MIRCVDAAKVSLDTSSSSVSTIDRGSLGRHGVNRDRTWVVNKPKTPLSRVHEVAIHASSRTLQRACSTGRRPEGARNRRIGRVLDELHDLLATLYSAVYGCSLTTVTRLSANTSLRRLSQTTYPGEAPLISISSLVAVFSWKRVP